MDRRKNDSRMIRLLRLKTPDRMVDKGLVSELVKSIHAIGLVTPLSIDSHYRITDGYHRFLALQRLGKIECSCVMKLTEKELIVLELRSLIKRINKL